MKKFIKTKEKLDNFITKAKNENKVCEEMRKKKPETKSEINTKSIETNNGGNTANNGETPEHFQTKAKGNVKLKFCKAHCACEKQNSNTTSTTPTTNNNPHGTNTEWGGRSTNKKESARTSRHSTRYLRVRRFTNRERTPHRESLRTSQYAARHLRVRRSTDRKESRSQRSLLSERGKRRNGQTNSGG